LNCNVDVGSPISISIVKHDFSKEISIFGNILLFRKTYCYFAFIKGDCEAKFCLILSVANQGGPLNL